MSIRKPREKIPRTAKVKPVKRSKRIAVAAIDSSMLALPNEVITKADISRLVLEAEYVDNQMTTQSVRKKAGAQTNEKTITPGVFAEFLTINKLSFNDSPERTDVIRKLRALKDDVPVLHMTFSVPADRESLARLTKWVRASVHQQAIIEAGLQPSLIAGVVLRTPNHMHDFSLRAAMKESRGLLLKELETRRGNR